MLDKDTRTDTPVAVFSALLSLCAVAWAISHAYRGIFHDAALYTLQGLSHSSTSLSHDVFLRFGSQDRFTIFGSLYGSLIQILGPEPAAAALTFLSQVGVVAAAWWLARSVMSRTAALFAIAIFVSVPGQYGADQIFACIESFITPRMAAESFVLGSLAAAFTSRPRTSVCLMVCAALFHPIIASPGVGGLIIYYARTTSIRLYLFFALSIAALLYAQASVMPHGQWGRFDSHWLALVEERSPYLFLRHWSFDDWGRVSVTVFTLMVGLLVLAPSAASKLCCLGLGVGVLGFFLTFVGCDVLKLVLVTQAQPWRCQWLMVTVAILLLPIILKAQWNSVQASRASAMLLVSSWIFGIDQLALAAGSLAMVCQIASPRIQANHAKLFFWGSCALVVIALAWRIASNFEFTDSYYLDGPMPVGLKRLISFSRDGLFPVGIITGCWLLTRWRQRLGLVVTWGLFTAASIFVMPQAVRQWTHQEYSASTREQFSIWRDRMPKNAEIYWQGSPINSWLLLDRPNYVSTLQSSGFVFSRPTAVEIERRALRLQEFLPVDSIMDFNASGSAPARSAEQLQGICTLSEFDFLVTNAKLDREPVAIEPGKSPDDPKALKLYECRPQARAAAAAT